MPRPSVLIYSINNPRGDGPDITVRFSRDSDSLEIALNAPESTPIRLHLDQVFSLMDILSHGMSALEYGPQPPESNIYDDENVTWMAPKLPDVAPDDDDMHDDPAMCYLIRHEHKDLYFGEKDKDTRRCESSIQDALVFRTKYEAYRWMQGMKHACSLRTHQARHVISFRESENAAKRYYHKDNPEGCLNRYHAFHFTDLEQASLRLEHLPSYFIKQIERVAI